MPRNYAKSQAWHALYEPILLRGYFDLLNSALQEADYPLIGWPAISDDLHAMGLRRQNGLRITIVQLRRWTRRRGLPVLHGSRNTYTKTPPLSSHHALMAWILSRHDTSGFFRVHSSHHPTDHLGYRARKKPRSPRRSDVSPGSMAVDSAGVSAPPGL